MCERGVDYSHIYQIGPCSRLRPNLKASLPKWLEHDIATPAEKNENQHVRSYRHIDLAQSKQIIVANRWIEIKHAPGQSTGKVTKFKMPAGLQRTGAIKCTTCLPEDEAMNLCAGVPPNAPQPHRPVEITWPSQHSNANTAFCTSRRTCGSEK